MAADSFQVTGQSIIDDVNQTPDDNVSHSNREDQCPIRQRLICSRSCEAWAGLWCTFWLALPSSRLLPRKRALLDQSPVVEWVQV